MGLFRAEGGVDMTRRLLLALVPLLLLGALLVVIVRSGPADAIRGENFRLWNVSRFSEWSWSPAPSSSAL